MADHDNAEKKNKSRNVQNTEVGRYIRTCESIHSLSCCSRATHPSFGPADAQQPAMEEKE